MKHIRILFLVCLTLPWQLSAQFMTPVIVNPDTACYTASFVAEWAGDTASIETYSIIGNHMMGKAIHLYPEPHLRQFEFYFNPDGSMREMDIQFYELTNTAVPLVSKSGFLPYRINMNAHDGVVDFRSVDKEGEKQWLYAAPRMDFFGGWTPILGQWQWLTDLVTQDRLDQNLRFFNYVLGEYDLQVIRKAEDKIIFKSTICAPITFYVNGNGKIDSVNAMGSPWNYKIQRVPTLDVEHFTKRFAGKKVIGDPSPQETFVSEIGDTRLTVSYGRPSKRGRKVFGELVPYGEVWRTGAGSPTKLISNSDLHFGDMVIPKGTYNLFTIPETSHWTLIFNTEEEAWGSAYRAAYDIAKVPMESDNLDAPVEKFTITIKPESDGGVLVMKWDKTMAKVRFSTTSP